MIEDKSMFDWWSIQHFTAGVVVGSLGLLNVGQYFVLHSLFEVWENTIGVIEWQKLGWRKYDGDSYRNILGDTISGTAGFYIIDKILDGKRASMPVLVSLLGLGALVFYIHPEPADQDFFADKVRKALMTAGVIGVVSVIGYAAFRKEVYS